MPKIKKFNIKLSIYQIQQSLRRQKFPFTDETLHEIDLLCNALKSKITPAVYFDTFQLNTPPPLAEKEDKNFPFVSGSPEGAVAVSVVISTLGSGADDFAAEHEIYSDVSSRGDEKRDTILLASSVLSQASEEVKKFAWKIIAEEIAEEKCVLSEKKPVSDIKSLESIKDILSKIEIFPTENGLKPTYSFVEYAFWLPTAKKKKN